MEVVLNLPDKVYGQVERLAGLLNQDLPRVLAETIENGLLPLGASVCPTFNRSRSCLMVIS